MHFVYRLFDSQLRLLYVGMSSADYRSRVSHHRRSKPWGKAIDSVSAEAFASRTQALRAEATAICDERPLHNIGQTLAMPLRGRRGRTSRCPVCESTRTVDPSGHFKAHWSASERCDGSGLALDGSGSDSTFAPELVRSLSRSTPLLNKGTREEEGNGRGRTGGDIHHGVQIVTREAATP
jgi:hypothetical protein